LGGHSGREERRKKQAITRVEGEGGRGKFKGEEKTKRNFERTSKGAWEIFNQNPPKKSNKRAKRAGGAKKKKEHIINKDHQFA